MNPGALVLVLAAVFAVAFADVFLKQASVSQEFGVAVRSPWFAAAIVMYLFQVVAFTYLFVARVELSVVGVIQTSLYAGVVLGAGVFIYKEALTATQYVGFAMAMAGVLLINLRPG